MTFYNIFSSSHSSSEKPLPEIIVDHREKSSSVVPFLLNKPVSLIFKQLPIADYLIRDTAIERKTIVDLKASIINKRIFDQIRNLRQYEKFILLLEGIIEEDLYSLGPKIHENAFRGFLLSLALSQAPLLFTQNAEDTAKYLCILALKEESPTPSPLRPKPILFSPHQQKQFILEGFPGIGPVAAEKLLAKFSSLKEIFNASEEELEKILGKKSSLFHKMLNEQA